MLKKITLAILILSGILMTSCFRNIPLTPKKVLIDNNWTFQKAGSDTTYDAIVPGCVHLDLMANGVIPDPYFGDNEKKVLWIENEDWTYQTRFRANSLILDYQHINLVFEGLDTYADVYLNDSLVLQADNMFRKWTIDVKGILESGFNDLEVRFHSPVRINHEKAALLPYTLPDERAFSRKAPYMFGWDWGPRLVTSGIWKPVYIETWEDVKIEGWRVVTDSLGHDLAKLRLVMDVAASDTMNIECRYKFSVQDRETTPVHLEKGQNTVVIPFEIEDPKLWWTNNLGEAFLYDFSISLRKKDELLDRLWDKFALRTLELVNEPDENGSSFYFRLNGVPVFMKGANYIPEDNFPSRVTPGHYEKLVESARLANMNMLRVWGGGIYEDDYFYQLCDRNGILVWQDFMFACAMYPGDQEFLQNVKEEAIQQVNRLHNHPCLALWCGNNEVDEAWHNWGWQKQFGYSPEDSARIWHDYLEVFETILPEVVAEQDGVTPYWPSSPEYGWGRKESLTHGDMHYWGVWWGREPFSAFNNKVGRFMSEYGFQGYAPYRTFEEVIDKDQLMVGSAEMLNHQKHPFGEEEIREFMKEDYPLPPNDSLQDYSYLSQLTQAYGIRTAIEAHRRAMPYCMGTLYWQLNDCWPAVSWSGLDYKNRWKALHYVAARAYREILVSAIEDHGQLRIYLINDQLDVRLGKLALSLVDFNGKIARSDTLEMTAPATTSREAYTLSLDKWLRGIDRSDHFIRIQFLSGKNTLASTNYFLARPKEMKLSAPDITNELIAEKNEVRVTLYCDVLVKDVFLEFKGHEGRFSDNFFDLLPGEQKEVTFYPEDEENLPAAEDLLIKHVNGMVEKYQGSR